MAANLGADPSWRGFLRYLALFVPVWWAWAGFAFYATRFDTDDLVYRVLTLLGMFAVAALATSIPDALHGGENTFVVTYVLVRVLLLLLYARARRHVERARALANWFMLMFGVAVVAWLASIPLPSPWKYVLWAVALAFELGAPPRAWRLIRNAPIHPAHIPERFGLLTIIVLGEAVIAVVLGTSRVSWTPLSGTAAFTGFVVAATIWWLYFDFLDSSMVGRGLVRGMTFVYAHYFVAAGIAALGVGVKLAILSAATDAHYEDAGWVAALGVAVCMLGIAAIHAATPPALVDIDVVLRAATGVLALVLVALRDVVSPIAVLAILAAALVAQVVLELAGHEAHTHT